jgi:hypothetical protein
MLERDLRIWQRGSLDRHLRLSLPMASCGEYDRAAGERLVDERTQSIGTGEYFSAGLSDILMTVERASILRASQGRNDGQNCYGKQADYQISRRYAANACGWSHNFQPSGRD